uniref:hypothetical protein n=1 Tax=Nonomuraea bangladeshensis TaxID=404385 RepID=UPI003F491465
MDERERLGCGLDLLFATPSGIEHEDINDPNLGGRGIAAALLIAWGSHRDTEQLSRTIGHLLGKAFCAKSSVIVSPTRPGCRGRREGGLWDHLTDAFAQVQSCCQAKIPTCMDGAGATHDLLSHLEWPNSTRRHCPLRGRLPA